MNIWIYIILIVIILLCSIKNKLDSYKGQITFNKVPAHSGIIHNETADRLAKLGANQTNELCIEV